MSIGKTKTNKGRVESICSVENVLENGMFENVVVLSIVNDVWQVHQLRKCDVKRNDFLVFFHFLSVEAFFIVVLVVAQLPADL